MTYFNPDPKPKTKRLKGKKRTELRLMVAKRENNICQKCDGYAPPYINGIYDPFRCGDLKHIKSVGAGGEDTEENAEWWCHLCHMKEHNGEFLKW